MAISLEQFVQHLTRSGLISAVEIASFQDGLPPDKRPKDAESLARELVLAKRLTKYQAQAVYQGKAKGLVFGDYRVLDKLGQGGMGVVLKAEHRRMKRMVAIKMLPPAALKSPQAVQRFYREAEAAARLNHSNIVQAYDASEFDGVHYLVMEYVDGKDLGCIVKECGPLPIALAVGYLAQAARGLEYAHEENVVHRDIKPANLLVDKKGVVKILDMGLARIAGLSEENDADRLTASGQVMGTCDYMAPEQAMDTHTADRRADIYSLGCTLYRLLTGDVLYKGDSLVKILISHQQAPIPSLCKARQDAPPQLDAVFQKMVAKKPEDRYQSMAEVIVELEACLGPRTPSSQTMGAFPTDSTQQSVSDNLSFLQQPAAGRMDTAVKCKTAADQEETLVRHAEQETGTQLGLAGRLLAIPRRKTAVAAAVGLTLLGIVSVAFWAVTIRIRHPDGTQTTLRVPEGTEVSITKAGQVDVTVKADGGQSVADKGRSHPAASTQEWVALFGSLATCRKTGTGDWRVEDGVLRGHNGTGMLYSPEEFGDVELTADVKINAEGNSGIFLRTSSVADKPLPAGYQVQVIGSKLRGKGPAEYTGSLWGYANVRPNPIQDDQWFHVRFVAQSNHFLVEIDGKTLVDYTDSANRFQRGVVGLELYGDVTDVSFRNVRARSLPAVGDQGQKPAAGSVDVLPRRNEVIQLVPLVDVQQDSVVGNWKATPGGIALEQPSGAGALQLPYEPPEEYDYEIEFTPQGGGMNVNQYVVAAGHPFAWKLNSHGVKPPLYGFELLDGKFAKDNPEAAVRKSQELQSGKRCLSTIEVRRGSIRALVNDEEYVKWSGDFSRFSMESITKLRNERCLGIGSYKRGVVFHRIGVREITGRGKFTRPIHGDDHPPSGAADSSNRTPSAAVAPFDATKAKQHQEAWAKFLGVPIEMTNSIGMKLVLMPPGEFEMGSPKELIEEEMETADSWSKGYLPSEGPRHRVRITRPFCLGMYEVTQEEYQRVVGANPSAFSATGNGKDLVVGQDTKRLPVELVSWDEAVEFCRKLSEMVEEKAAGRRYRLPTEAQWEYACRAGSTGRWCFTPASTIPPAPNARKYEENLLSNYGWFNDNSGRRPHAVGGKQHNVWGLYDMYGNVWEWCQDCYDDGYYVKSPADDPTGPLGGSDHVFRGGSWRRPATSCRSANRRNGTLGRPDDALGFRVAVVLAEQPSGATPPPFAAP